MSRRRTAAAATDGGRWRTVAFDRPEQCGRVLLYTRRPIRQFNEARGLFVYAVRPSRFMSASRPAGVEQRPQSHLVLVCQRGFSCPSLSSLLFTLYWPLTAVLDHQTDTTKAHPSRLLEKLPAKWVFLVYLLQYSVRR